MSYSELSSEQQQQIIRQRILGYEQDHFGHCLNIAALSSQPDSPERKTAVASAKAAQATIEGAISACKALLT